MTHTMNIMGITPGDRLPAGVRNHARLYPGRLSLLTKAKMNLQARGRHAAQRHVITAEITSFPRTAVIWADPLAGPDPAIHRNTARDPMRASCKGLCMPPPMRARDGVADVAYLQDIGFVHLHVHSSYSLLEGALKIASSRSSRRPTSSRRWRSPTPTTSSAPSNSPRSSRAPASSRSRASSSRCCFEEAGSDPAHGPPAPRTSCCWRRPRRATATSCVS